MAQYNAEVGSEPELTFEAITPLGFQVQVTSDRWRLITTMKHPVMVGREDAIKEGCLDHSPASEPLDAVGAVLEPFAVRVVALRAERLNF